LSFLTRPANVTAALKEPAVFRCGVSIASQNLTFNFYGQANYSLNCPNGHVEDIPRALYGSCEMQKEELVAVWTLKGTSYSDNGTRVMCRQSNNTDEPAAYLHVYQSSISKAILIGCTIGGFFGILLVFGLVFSVLRRSQTLQRCFRGKQEEEDMDTIPPAGPRRPTRDQNTPSAFKLGPLSPPGPGRPVECERGAQGVGAQSAQSRTSARRTERFPRLCRRSRTHRVGVVSLVFAEEQNYYHRLRVGGLILAAVLCLIGITILFSGHCRCKFNQDKRRRTGSNAQQMLSDQVLDPEAMDLAVQQVVGLWVSGRQRGREGGAILQAAILLFYVMVQP
ncbi:hypothetical protein L3Q82_013539, partial [Scortum barcoo]